MRFLSSIAFFTLLLILSAGCAPRVRVRPSPGPTDSGIRYYRPKPYLRIEPAGESVTEGRVTTETPSDEFVAIALEYLPDFSEEYAIEVTPGLGTADVEIGLSDGWNLTSINQDLDSQFDENVTAIADLARAAAGFVPTSGDGEKSRAAGASPPPGSQQKFVVSATNVPLGYYESVIGKDRCGKKRLYGWRYIGFLPFQPCPTDVCGTDQVACNGVPSDIYGLVFEKGVMTFKRLDQVEHSGEPERVAVSTGTLIVASTERKLSTLAKAIRNSILIDEGIESSVDATLLDEGDVVELRISLAEKSSDSRAEFIKRMLENEDVESALDDLDNPLPSFPELLGVES
ncbi:MAG: hypothetical protein AAGJ83_02830 [Planctomycetota bacterium]